MEKEIRKMEGTFCSAPYIASYIGTQGEFMPCCIFNPEHKLSTYSGDDDLQEHMNSPAAVQLRKDLHNGVKVKGYEIGELPNEMNSWFNFKGLTYILN